MPPSGNSIGWRVGVAHQRVDLRGVRVAVAERNTGQVARDRDHRHGLPDRIQRDDDERVGQGFGAAGSRIQADQEDVQPGRLAGEGHARNRTGARSGEHLGERRLGGRAVAPGDCVGDGRECHDREETHEPEAPRLPGIPAVDEGVEECDPPPAEHGDVQDEQHRQHRWRRDPSGQHRRRVRICEHPGEEREDRRREAEEQRRPGSTVQRLADARRNGRQRRGEEPADVGGSAVWPLTPSLIGSGGSATARRRR